MIRYVTGLLGAFLVFGAALVIALTSILIIEGRPVRFITVLDAWFQLGLLGTTGIALIVGPTVLAMQQLSKRRLSVTAAALCGAGLGPALLIALWLLVRERDETFAALLQFWLRLPSEFIVGVLPHAAASAFFAGWLVAGRQRRTLTALLAAAADQRLPQVGTPRGSSERRSRLSGRTLGCQTDDAFELARSDAKRHCGLGGIAR